MHAPPSIMRRLDLMFVGNSIIASHLRHHPAGGH
jgi:hypothetical protein